MRLSTYLTESTKIKPDVFTRTIYRIPTDQECQNIESCGCSCDEIIDGLSYTIIGRGIKRENESQMIKDSISRLVDMFPDNEEYKKALHKYK